VKKVEGDMGIIERLLGKSIEQLEEEKKGTYLVIRRHNEPTLKRIQFGGDYIAVVALHIKGQGGSGNTGKHCNGGSKGKYLVHAEKDGNVLCAKRFKGDVIEDRYSVEVTCHGCLKKIKQHSLLSPPFFLELSRE
jgi:hypothetical protein